MRSLLTSSRCCLDLRGAWIQRGFPFIPTFLVVVALRASKWLFGLYVLSCVVGVFWKEFCFSTCILEGRLFRRMWNFKFCNTGLSVDNKCFGLSDPVDCRVD
ncbi:uncharacterized protein [Coffea arabica]|uniref:Transmembrane protein n=1 Tax=Coffea arabica TaxID=13443 RepID=A0ABM4UIX0_COFAR